MGNIDNPIAQIKKGAEKEPRPPGDAIALGMIGWIPIIGDKIKKALDSIRGHDKDARIEFLINAIVEQLQVHETGIDDILKRLDEPEFNRLLSVAIERIFFGANQRKVKRFAAVITDAATHNKTEQEYEDAASFIRALDELSEYDIKVLKHLYNHQRKQVQENHSLENYEFFAGNRMVAMLDGANSLGMQKDEFYSRCNRLSGYGLALQLTKPPGMGGDLNVFAFRMTLLGKRLVKMLVNAGEET